MCQDRSQGSGRERSNEMVTANARRSASRLGYIGVGAALVLIGWSAGSRGRRACGRAEALVQTTGGNAAASDLPGGYVVVPKIVVHTTGGTPPIVPGGVAIDTLIQMTNTNEEEQIRSTAGGSTRTAIAATACRLRVPAPPLAPFARPTPSVYRDRTAIPTGACWTSRSYSPPVNRSGSPQRAVCRTFPARTAVARVRPIPDSSLAFRRIRSAAS